MSREVARVVITVKFVQLAAALSDRKACLPQCHGTAQFFKLTSNFTTANKLLLKYRSAIMDFKAHSAWHLLQWQCNCYCFYSLSSPEFDFRSGNSLT